MRFLAAAIVNIVAASVLWLSDQSGVIAGGSDFTADIIAPAMGARAVAGLVMACGFMLAAWRDLPGGRLSRPAGGYAGLSAAPAAVS